MPRPLIREVRAVRRPRRRRRLPRPGVRPLDRRPDRDADGEVSEVPGRAGRRSAWTSSARWWSRSRPTTGRSASRVTTGGEPGAWIVERHLARFVEGSRSADLERIWDQMYNGPLYYGRKGLVLNAISAVDLALWDLLGRVRAGAGVRAARRRGPRRADLLRHRTAARPGQGAGLHRRQAAGAARPGRGRGRAPRPSWAAGRDAGTGRRRLLADVGLLDVARSRSCARLARARRRVGLRWMEEALLPDDYWGYAELRRRMPARMLLTDRRARGDPVGLPDAAGDGRRRRRPARRRLVRRHDRTAARSRRWPTRTARPSCRTGRACTRTTSW